MHSTNANWQEMEEQTWERVHFNSAFIFFNHFLSSSQPMILASVSTDQKKRDHYDWRRKGLTVWGDGSE